MKYTSTRRQITSIAFNPGEREHRFQTFPPVVFKKALPPVYVKLFQLTQRYNARIAKGRSKTVNG